MFHIDMIIRMRSINEREFRNHYDYQMDDCDEIMNLGFADVSYMSLFND